LHEIGRALFLGYFLSSTESSSLGRSFFVADLAASADPHEQLVAYSLGSCIGVALYDPVAKVRGLPHFMLPDSRMDRTSSPGDPAGLSGLAQATQQFTLSRGSFWLLSSEN